MKHLYCIGIVINEYKILLMHRINNILADIEFNCYLIFDRIKNKVGASLFYYKAPSITK